MFGIERKTAKKWCTAICGIKLNFCDLDASSFNGCKKTKKKKKRKERSETGSPGML